MFPETRLPPQVGDGVECEMDEVIVKRILRLLCRKGAYLTTTRAQKLLYLIERECVLDTGHRCLGLDYRFDRFGMYSPALNHLLTHLDSSEDLLEVKDIMSERGAGRMIVCPGPVRDEDMPDHVERAVAVVLALYGFLNTPSLIAAAKETSPFIFAKKGDYLDWSLLDEERCRPGEELSEEGIRKLERAIKSTEAGKGRAFENVDEVMQYLFS